MLGFYVELLTFAPINHKSAIGQGNGDFPLLILTLLRNVFLSYHWQALELMQCTVVDRSAVTIKADQLDASDGPRKRINWHLNK